MIRSNAWPLAKSWRSVIGSLSLVGALVAAPENLRIMGPSMPDGGYASTARAMREALLATGGAKNIDVYYVTGAGASSVGLIQFVREAKGDPAHLMVSGYAMVGAALLNRSPASLNDVTPIARLTAETPAIVVPVNSPLRDAKQLVARLKAEPGKTLWAVGSKGGIGHTASVMFALINGIDLPKMNFKFFGTDDMVPALLNGDADVGLLFNYGSYEREIREGRLRLIAITSAQRRLGIDCPTLEEQKIDMVFENWRGIVAAPGITAEQRKFLAGAVERAAQSQAWRDILKREGWDDAYLAGPEFEAFLKTEQPHVEQVFRALGMIKSGRL